MARNGRAHTLGLAAGLLAPLVAPSWALAIVVLSKGSSQPVMGYLVRQDSQNVVVREELPAGKSREVTLRRSNIDELIETVSPQRLTELDPARPKQYREYAEELAEKRKDPEARDAAIRLYLIAAARSDDKLRRGSILGLIPLARAPEEERRFRAAAYLCDPQHDASILGEAVTPQVASITFAPRSSELLNALRLIRRGKGNAARAILQQPAMQSEITAIESIVGQDELQQACLVRQLNDQQLLKIVRAELLLEGIDPAASRPPSNAGPSASWSVARQRNGLESFKPLELDRLTEFDPAECVFRDGKWVRP